MNITFRKISSQESFKKVVAFLSDDVVKSGGSAGEVVDVHGKLIHATVCKVPWGTLLINREVSRLEAITWFVQADD